jgi:hypothetical protein
MSSRKNGTACLEAWMLVLTRLSQRIDDVSRDLSMLAFDSSNQNKEGRPFSAAFTEVSADAKDY